MKKRIQKEAVTSNVQPALARVGHDVKHFTEQVFFASAIALHQIFETARAAACSRPRRRREGGGVPSTLLNSGTKQFEMRIA